MRTIKRVRFDLEDKQRRRGGALKTSPTPAPGPTPPPRPPRPHHRLDLTTTSIYVRQQSVFLPSAVPKPGQENVSFHPYDDSPFPPPTIPLPPPPRATFGSPLIIPPLPTADPMAAHAAGRPAGRKPKPPRRHSGQAILNNQQQQANQQANQQTAPSERATRITAPQIPTTWNGRIATPPLTVQEIADQTLALAIRRGTTTAPVAQALAAAEAAAAASTVPAASSEPITAVVEEPVTDTPEVVETSPTAPASPTITRSSSGSSSSGSLRGARRQRVLVPASGFVNTSPTIPEEPIGFDGAGDAPDMSVAASSTVDGQHAAGPAGPTASPVSPAVVTATEELASLTAKAAMRGAESINSSYQPPRHYEGCMLCEPMPSPDSSVSSLDEMDELFPLQGTLGSGSGPAPDAPLPDHRALPKHVGRNRRSVEFDPLKTYLEGEVAPLSEGSRHKLIPRSSGFASGSHSRHSSGSDASGRPLPLLQSQPVYMSPNAHGESLSTLMEAEEETTGSNSRIPSQILRPRTESDPYRRVNLHSRGSDVPRPGTAATAESSHTIRPAEDPDNESQDELMEPQPASPTRWATFKEKITPQFITDGVARVRAMELGRVFTWRPLQPPPPVFTQEAIEMNTFTTRNKANNYGDGPHPGIRRDEPSEDGTFEVVDLGPPVGCNGLPPQITKCIIVRSLKVRNGRPLTMAEDRRWRARRMMYFLILLGFLCASMIVIFPTLFVGFPRMAQKTVNKANLELFEFRIDNVTPDSFDLNTQVFVTGVGQSAVLNPTTFRLAPEYAVLPEMNLEAKKKRDLDGSIPRFVPRHLRTSWVKRNHIPGHVVPGFQNSSSLVLGFLEVQNRTRVGKGVGQPFLMNGGFRVTDTHVWADILEAVVFGEEGYRAKVEGTAKLRYGGLAATTVVTNKTFVFPPMGGVELAVKDLSLVERDGKNFTAALAVTGKSATVLNMGTLHFDLILDDVRIRHATVDGATLQKDTHEFPLSGKFDQKALGANSKQYGKLLAAIYIGGEAALNTTIVFQGRNVTSSGREVPWLVPIARRLNASVALNTPHRADYTEGFDMTFDFVAANNGTGRVGSGSLSVNLTLPSRDTMTAQINHIQHHLSLSVDGRRFATLETPLSPVKNVGLSGIMAEFPYGNMTLTDDYLYSQHFLEPLIKEKKFDIGISGSVAVDVATTIGNASVFNLPHKEETWHIEGYGGLIDGNRSIEIEQVKLVQSTGVMLQLVGKMVFEGTGSLGVDLGTVNFDVSYDGEESRLGIATVSSFKLQHGSNVAPMSLSLSRGDGFPSLINDLFAGRDVGLIMSAGTLGASSSAVVSAALDGLRIPTYFKSPGYQFIDQLTIRHNITADTMALRVNLKNPFSTPFSVSGLRLSVSGGGSILGSISTASISALDMPVGQGETADIEFTPAAGRAASEIADMFRNTQITLNGNASVAWGSFSTNVEIENMRHTVLYEAV